MGTPRDHGRAHAMTTASSILINESADALLLALAGQYRAALGAYSAFDEAGLAWDGDIATALRGAMSVAGERADKILGAICAIQANGLSGAFVQLEAAAICADRVGASADPMTEDEDMLRWAVWSISKVLRVETGIEGDLIGELVPYDDPFEIDAAAVTERAEAVLRRAGKTPERRIRAPVEEAL